MKRLQFHRFIPKAGKRIPRIVKGFIVLLAVSCCLGVVAAQAQLFGSAQGSTGSIYSSISQSIQSGMSSNGICLSGPEGTQSSCLTIGDGWASGSVCVGTGTCPCTTCTTEPAEVIKPCDPFEALVGKWITIQLDGGVSVAGMLEKECRGFLILRGQGVTFTVNIQKILFIESH